jgi:hypothetical protein
MATVIEHARVTAAHDGVAELVVTVAYDNGGRSYVTLDEMASAALMQSCAADCLEDLQGHSWQKVRDALAFSYNRFQ